MSAFTYNGVTVRLANPTGRHRLHLNKLHRLIGSSTFDDDGWYRANEALNLLYLVDDMDGTFDFPVPYKAPTKDAVMAFIDGVFGAHEDLYLLWAKAVRSAREGTQNDPELLPSHELDSDQKKTSTSDKSEKKTA